MITVTAAPKPRAQDLYDTATPAPGPWSWRRLGLRSGKDYGLFYGNPLGARLERHAIAPTESDANQLVNFFNLLHGSEFTKLPSLTLGWGDDERGNPTVDRMNECLRFVAELALTDDGMAMYDFYSTVFYLATYAHRRRGELCPADVAMPTRVKLAPDYCKLSFGFMVEEYAVDGGLWDGLSTPDPSRVGWKPMMRGGLMYSGPGQVLDGSSPALTVALKSQHDCGKVHAWSTHT